MGQEKFITIRLFFIAILFLFLNSPPHTIATAHASSDVIVYAGGGGGDTAVALAYLKGLMDRDPSLSGTVVGAGYNLAQYNYILTDDKNPDKAGERISRSKRTLFTAEQSATWLNFLFKFNPNKHFDKKGYLPYPEEDPLIYEVNTDPIPSFIRSTWSSVDPHYDSGDASFKYSTGLDEYLLRQGMSGAIPNLLLIYTLAYGSKYRSPANQPMIGPTYTAQVRVAYTQLDRFIKSRPGSLHTVIDVGGDLTDFKSKGRDSNLLAMMLHIVQNMPSRDRPRVRLVVFGTGVDGHETPDVVQARLKNMHFIPADITSDVVHPFIATLQGAMRPQLETIGALKPNRATPLFLDALALSAAIESAAVDTEEKVTHFKTNLFSRSEIAGKPDKFVKWKRYFDTHPNLLEVFKTMASVYVQDIDVDTTVRNWTDEPVTSDTGFSDTYREIQSAMAQ